jgi:hypothetical protein
MQSQVAVCDTPSPTGYQGCLRPLNSGAAKLAMMSDAFGCQSRILAASLERRVYAHASDLVRGSLCICTDQ